MSMKQDTVKYEVWIIVIITILLIFPIQRECISIRRLGFSSDFLLCSAKQALLNAHSVGFFTVLFHPTDFTIDSIIVLYLMNTIARLDFKPCFHTLFFQKTSWTSNSPLYITPNVFCLFR